MRINIQVRELLVHSQNCPTRPRGLDAKPDRYGSQIFWFGLEPAATNHTHTRFNGGIELLPWRPQTVPQMMDDVLGLTHTRVKSDCSEFTGGTSGASRGYHKWR